MNATIMFAATALAITAMLCLTASRAWNGWLALKRLELDRAGGDEPEGPGEGDVAVRIELAAVRERLKRLEAIANGVEL
jgi:hypothetical protein